MTDTPTHDLALARAERDAWQTTCEELRHTIAGFIAGIESHLERIDAADQRARTLDAALAHEREAGRWSHAETTTALVTADREIAKLRAEVAELRKRPVLTVEAAVAAAREADWSSAERHDAETVVTAILAALGPVTLPAPDRAEGVARRMADTLHEMGAGSDSRPWASLDADTRSDRIVALEYALREELADPSQRGPLPKGG